MLVLEVISEKCTDEINTVIEINLWPFQLFFIFSFQIIKVRCLEKFKAITELLFLITSFILLNNKLHEVFGSGRINEMCSLHYITFILISLHN